MPFTSDSKKLIIAATFKVACGMLVGLVYQQYYGDGDTFGFFHHGKILIRLAHNDFLEYLDYIFTSDQGPHFPSGFSYTNPRAILMCKLTSIAYFLGGGNYWLSTIPFSLFSVWGLWIFYQEVTKLFPALSKYAYGVLFLLPTFVFWTSGILKESILLGCLGWLFAQVLKSVSKQSQKLNIYHLAFSIWCCYLLFQMKYYYAGALLPSIGVFFFSQRIDQASFISQKKNSFLLKIGILLLVGSFLLLSATQLHPNLHPESIVKAIVVNHHKMALQTANSNNLVQLNELTPTIHSLLTNLPSSWFQGLFRPYVWEEGHLGKQWTAWENALLFLLVIATTIKVIIHRNLLSQRLNNTTLNLLIASFIYFLLLSSLLPIAAPNLGNLMRYRTGFMPILLLWLFSVWTLQPEPKYAKR